MSELTCIASIVAFIVMGEAGICPPIAQAGIVWVMAHRIEAGESITSTLNAFYGWQEPTPSVMQIVSDTLSLKIPDPVPGAKYVLSKEDVRKLGARNGDWVFQCSGGAELHFFKEWPVQMNKPQSVKDKLMLAW